MSFKKLVLKNTTAMSLNERFTFLRGNHENTLRAIRENNALQQQASARNRRLAQQMERRPAVMAALKLKKRSLRQRLGQPQVSNVKERLSLPMNSPRGTLRGRGRGRATLRGRGIGGRSFSMLSLNEASDSFRFRRGQGRIFGSNGRRPFKRGTLSLRGTRGNRFNRSGMNSPRGGMNTQRGGGRGGTQRGQGASFRRGGRSGRGSMRSRGGRRGGRGGRGGRPQTTVPSKEELDLQLDQYMANTKSSLDKELDSYMNQAQPESWD